MKPFNLEEAKAGKPVCTRDGRNARVICTDKKGVYSVVALLTNIGDDSECTCDFSTLGKFYLTSDTDNDLFMAEGNEYVNLYRTPYGIMAGNEIFESEEDARNTAKDSAGYIKTVKL